MDGATREQKGFSEEATINAGIGWAYFSSKDQQEKWIDPQFASLKLGWSNKLN